MSIDIVTEEERFETARLQKETILALLRENGCRITKQRKIILEIIVEEDCTCCKEIYFKALKHDSSIGMATVYRMVNTLEEVGAINRKNTYRIECDSPCRKGKECIVTLDDNCKCCLKEKELEKVMQVGLHACGFIKNKQKKISKIEIQ